MYPEIFTNSNEDIQRRIIEIGTYIYFNGLSLFEDKNVETKELFYENHMKQLKFDYDKQLFELNQNYEKQNEMHSKSSQEVYNNNTSLLMKEKDEYISYLKSQIVNIEEKT